MTLFEGLTKFVGGGTRRHTRRGGKLAQLNPAPVSGGKKRRSRKHKSMKRKSMKRKSMKRKSMKRKRGGNVALQAAAVPFGLLALKQLAFGKKRVSRRRARKSSKK